MQHYIYIIGVTLTWIAIALTVIHVVMDNRQPAKTMAWVLVIFFLPVVGIVLYLFFGVNQRRERMVEQRSLDQLSKRSMLSFVEQQNLRVPDVHQPLVELFINENLSLPFKNNVVDIMTDGYAFTAALLKDIAQAQHHIHIDLYIIEEDPLGNLVADALIDKAHQGIRVRIVYDDVGCWKVSRRFWERMREEGIEIHAFLPVHFPTFTSKVNYRNHRKLIVIDGSVGYVGGMNIALRYVKGIKKEQKKGEAATYTPWRDTMLRMTGGAVYALQRAFLVDWYFVDRTLITDRVYYPATTVLPSPAVNNCLAQLVTSGPTTPYPEIMQGFVHIIATARRYIYMETPYFLPTEPVLLALKMAALRGIDVRLLVPLHSDARFVEWAGRSYLREVCDAGVQVWLYSRGFLHSKLMVVDDELATCGSTNIDFRSFENNFESNIFIYDNPVAMRLREVFLSDQQHANLLSDLPERMRPSFLNRLLESLARLLAPLF